MSDLHYWIHRRLPRTLRRRRTEIRQMSDEQFRLFMRELLKDPRPSNETGREARARRTMRIRALRRKQRAAHAIRNAPLPKNLPKTLLIYRRRDCDILNSFVPDRAKLWKTLPQRRLAPSPRRVELQNFTLAENPRETMRMLQRIALAECTEYELYVDFMDKACLDIAPYLILGKMLPRMAPVLRGGKIAPRMQKLVSAVQLTDFLQMQPFAEVGATDDIWAFPLQQKTEIEGVSPPPYGPQSRDRVAGHFVASINDWLGMPDIHQALSKEGQGLVSGMITEVLDNAEGHSSDFRGSGGWAMAGFMTKRRIDGKERYFCSVGILSIGHTIAGSFQGCHPKIQAALDSYCKDHGRRRGALSDETLITVCALQDGITSDPEKAENNAGGVGFQEVIDFINDLGGTEDVLFKPKLTILSGKACIQVRYPYICGAPDGDGTSTARTLWFNDENLRSVAPDRDFVFDLDIALPGTIISMVFLLDPAYLTRTVELK